MLYAFLPTVVAFAGTVLLILLLNPLARRIGWLDNPDARKQHIQATPLTGGVAMLAGLLFALYVNGSLFLQLPLVFALVALCVAGLVDDILHLSPRFRLLLQAGVALNVCLLTNFRMTWLGDLFGWGVVILPDWLGLLLPVFIIMAVVNAVNMIDGVDGLAGGVLLVSVLWLAALVGRVHGNVELPLIVMAVLMGYLAFNLRTRWRTKAAVFMGDAGSTMLGLLVTWLLISHSQPSRSAEHALPPVLVPWLLAVPLLDTASLIVSRSLRGHHPFEAARDHIHHLLLDAGLTERQVTVTVISFSMMISGTGVAFWIVGVPEVILLSLFGIGFVAYYYAIHHTGQIFRVLRRFQTWQLCQKSARGSGRLR